MLITSIKTRTSGTVTLTLSPELRYWIDSVAAGSQKIQDVIAGVKLLRSGSGIELPKYDDGTKSRLFTTPFIRGKTLMVLAVSVSVVSVYADTLLNGIGATLRNLGEFMGKCGVGGYESLVREHLSITTVDKLRAMTADDMVKMVEKANLRRDMKMIDQVIAAIRRYSILLDNNYIRMINFRDRNGYSPLGYIDAAIKLLSTTSGTGTGTDTSNREKPEQSVDDHLLIVYHRMKKFLIAGESLTGDKSKCEKEIIEEIRLARERGVTVKSGVSVAVRGIPPPWSAALVAQHQVGATGGFLVEGSDEFSGEYSKMTDEAGVDSIRDMLKISMAQGWPCFKHREEQIYLLRGRGEKWFLLPNNINLGRSLVSPGGEVPLGLRAWVPSTKYNDRIQSEYTLTFNLLPK